MNLKEFYENFSALKTIIYNTKSKTDKKILIILNTATVIADINDIIFSYVTPNSTTEKNPIFMAFQDAIHEKARETNVNIGDYIIDNVILIQNATLDCGNINKKVDEILITIDSITAFTLI